MLALQTLWVVATGCTCTYYSSDCSLFWPLVTDLGLLNLWKAMDSLFLILPNYCLGHGLNEFYQNYLLIGVCTTSPVAEFLCSAFSEYALPPATLCSKCSMNGSLGLGTSPDSQCHGTSPYHDTIPTPWHSPNHGTSPYHNAAPTPRYLPLSRYVPLPQYSPILGYTAIHPQP